VLRIFAVRILTGESPVIYEDGNQLRDYVSVYDVVRANLLALEDSRANYRSFNVGGDRKVSVGDLARIVADAAGASVEPGFPGIYRVGDTRHIFCGRYQTWRARRRPLVPMAEIVREYLSWVAALPGLRDTYTRRTKR